MSRKPRRSATNITSDCNPGINQKSPSFCRPPDCQTPPFQAPLIMRPPRLSGFLTDFCMGIGSQVAPRGLYVFHDHEDDLTPFVYKFGQSVRKVFAEINPSLPAASIAQRGLSIDEIEQIITEEESDMETFLLCTVVELKRYQPDDIVIATSTRSQEFICELKGCAQSHGYQRIAEHVLLLDDILAQVGQPANLPPAKAYDIYYEVAVRHLYNLS